MKIGTFVNTKYVSLNEYEKRYFKENIINCAKLYFKDLLKYTLKIEEIDDISQSKTLSAIFKFKNHCVMRSDVGDCFIPHYVRIEIFKAYGYDAYKDNKEDNLASFNCDINLMGDFRRFRAKNIEHSVGIIPTYYTYDTDLTDIDISNGIKGIAEYVRNSHPTNLSFKKGLLIVK